LIEYDGEQYLTVSEIAERFKISRGTCYNNLLRQVKECYLPGRKNALYRRSAIESFSEVRLIAHRQGVSIATKQLHTLPHPLTMGT